MQAFLLAGICLFLAVRTLSAQALTLAWDTNPEPDIIGYELGYGTTPGQYSTVIDTGSSTQTEVTGLVQGTTYYFAVLAVNTQGAKSSYSAEVSYFVEPDDPIPTGWTLHYVDSEESAAYQGAYAFDGDPNSIWHTAWSGTPAPQPHEIQINMGSNQLINGFRYLPRQGTILVGNVGQFEFYVSSDGVNWGSPVATGTFANNRDLKEIRFAGINCQYIRFRGLTDANGGTYMTVAELDVIQDAGSVPVNRPPVAVSKSLSTTEDTGVAVTLEGTDADSNNLTYTIVNGPAHGSVSGTSPNRTYTPTANFHGSDSFTYVANDGTVNSAPATVTIMVTPVNDVPTVAAQTVAMNEDASLQIALAAADADGDLLTLNFVSNPTKGVLSGTFPLLTYTPFANLNGSDEFIYRVNDGKVNSANAKVTINIAPVNDAPSVANLSVATLMNQSAAIVLTGSDVDGNPLTFTYTNPAKGTISGTPPNLTYTPNPNVTGNDQFTFKAFDGSAYSSNATVSISIASVNHAPVAANKSVTTNEDAPIFILLTATDSDGNNLTYIRETNPAHGTITGTPPNLTYIPAPNFHGSDTFKFHARDGLLDSNSATVTITVTPVNDTPLAAAQSVTTGQGVPVAITLTGSDVEGSALTFSITENPANGALTGTFPNQTYTPKPGFFGSDKFKFKASDGPASSAAATVTITVTEAPVVPENAPPVFPTSAIAATATEDSSFSGKLTATDADDDVLTYRKVSGPAWLTVSPTGSLGGKPLNADVGRNAFVVSATDPSKASATANLVITVANTNDAPVFKLASFEFPDGSEKAAYSGNSLAWTASDPDVGDQIAFSMVSGPEWLSVAADGNLRGTPKRNDVGVSWFTIRVTDTRGATADAALKITINRNSLPAPWKLDKVGDAMTTDPATYSAGVITLAGTGQLSKKKDTGNFGYQTLSGEGTIVARIRDVDNTGKSTRVGLMIRQSLAPDSRQTFVGVDGKGKLRLVSRTSNGGKSTDKSRAGKASDNSWLKLTRKGKTITAYRSSNGTIWRKAGSIKLKLPKNAYIGLTVSSGDKEKRNVSKFSNVRINP